MIRITLATLLGVAVSVASGLAMEVIVIVGVFSVDIVTGGILRYWREIGSETLD